MNVSGLAWKVRSTVPQAATNFEETAESTNSREIRSVSTQWDLDQPSERLDAFPKGRWVLYVSVLLPHLVVGPPADVDCDEPFAMALCASHGGTGTQPPIANERIASLPSQLHPF